MADEPPHVIAQARMNARIAARHGPHVQQRSARRGRSIVESNRRAELVGAVEFLHAVLRIPGGEPGGGPRSTPGA